jgi:2-phospho-L-lactate guanylyltransferase
MSPPAVLVPVKAFAEAKARLAVALDASARAELARVMAERVLHAAEPLDVRVACDDDGVADWAFTHGARVVRTDGLDLNGSIAKGLAVLRDEGVPRVVIAHADLPFATALAWTADFPGATLVPDRHDDGTNVLSIPTTLDFEPMYGPGSFGRHVAQLRALACALRIARLAELQWDVDDPADVPEGRAIA